MEGACLVEVVALDVATESEAVGVRFAYKLAVILFFSVDVHNFTSVILKGLLLDHPAPGAIAYTTGLPVFLTSFIDSQFRKILSLKIANYSISQN